MKKLDDVVILDLTRDEDKERAEALILEVEEALRSAEEVMEF